MKILLTVHQFLPEHSAGTEILAFATAKELQRQGHDVRVLAGFPGRAARSDAERFESYSYDGLAIERFQYARVPMGDQHNVVEAEYNNAFVGAHLRGRLRSWKPDVVHFFHLRRLSASCIDVCAEECVPTVLTCTDFWFACPMGQLRLPDGSFCSGPSELATNCLLHLIDLRIPSTMGRVVRAIPLGLVNRVGHAVLEIMPERIPGTWIRALANRQAFLRERLSKIDRILVPTQFMESKLRESGVQRERLIVSRYGIDAAHIERKMAVGSKENICVIFVGTLHEPKGAHLLIEAMKSLETSLNIELRIYGRLEEFPGYSRMLKGLASNDPRISFCGTFPNEEIAAIMSAADVLVVPSLWYENAPLVVHSAQAAGCVVVASNVPGLVEMVRDDEDGLLFVRGNARDLAAKLRRLASDRALLLRLAQRVPKPRSTKEYVAELTRIYRQLVANMTKHDRAVSQ